MKGYLHIMTYNTKKEMIEKVAEKRNISKVKAKEIVEDVISVMEELIMDETHDGLDVYGLVRFEVKEVPERMARNPKTSETIKIDSHNKISAKISSRMKKAVR